ncbi:MAG: methyltransferase domain-containing protein [Bacillota bacterium]|nr:methyltransferase domain-containing protein [Bacillota bacterium]
MERIDWNELWKANRRSENKNNTSQFWDSFAVNFRKKARDGKKDPYIEKFYELMEAEEGDTIFDMGCASGTLAIPYAQKGHEIYAADFSEEMLRVLMEGAEEAGVADRIHPILLDWNEDWFERDLPQCDIAIASRSLIFEDLTASLKKLESVAVRRVCVGAWDTPVSGFDRYVAKAIGYERSGYGVNWFVMNELMDRDRYPEQIFIRSPFRIAKFGSFEEGVRALRESFRYGLTDEQEKALAEYCREHLKFHSVEDGGEISARGDAQGKKEFWQLDHSDMSTMAFIRWEVKE